MISEIIIVCLCVYILLGDYMEAAAKMLHEREREKELENDMKEIGYEDHSEDR